jgi:6-pyruvoyltetrahydropterin/6-carboxytetrahydropterin synthase
MRVTRRYRFAASHRLHSDGFSENENRELYGKCSNPFGHGHDYVLDVTASGPVNAAR